MIYLVTRAIECACLLGILLLSIACNRARVGEMNPCQVYRPHLAKATFDGRVGTVLVHNVSRQEAAVKVYHPDGSGDFELVRRVAPGAVLALSGDDGGRLTLGNDWGIQVDQSCVATLGQAADWASGEFSLNWDGTNLHSGLGPAQ